MSQSSGSEKAKGFAITGCIEDTLVASELFRLQGKKALLDENDLVGCDGDDEADCCTVEDIGADAAAADMSEDACSEASEATTEEIPAESAVAEGSGAVLTIIVDVTECPIQRPKKTAQILFGKEENAHQEAPSRGREVNAQDRLRGGRQRKTA